MMNNSNSSRNPLILPRFSDYEGKRLERVNIDRHVQSRFYLQKRPSKMSELRAMLFGALVCLYLQQRIPEPQS